MGAPGFPIAGQCQNIVLRTSAFYGIRGRSRAFRCYSGSSRRIVAWCPSGSVPALENPLEIGRLPGVLQVICDDAYKPHAEGDGRVPTLVHNRVQVVVAQLSDIADSGLVYRLVIAAEVIGLGAHSGDLARIVTVAGV